jgi:hypothetical protein
VLVKFAFENSYENRLSVRTDYKAVTCGVDGQGVIIAEPILITVLKNIYPGLNHVNGTILHGSVPCLIDRSGTAASDIKTCSL